MQFYLTGGHFIMFLSTAALLHRKPTGKRNLQQFETIV